MPTIVPGEGPLLRLPYVVGIATTDWRFSKKEDKDDLVAWRRRVALERCAKSAIDEIDARIGRICTESRDGRGAILACVLAISSFCLYIRPVSCSYTRGGVVKW